MFNRPLTKQLRLSGSLDSLEARNRQAIDAKLAYTEFLALLIEDEVARREQKKYASQLRRAAFRMTKTLEAGIHSKKLSTRYVGVVTIGTAVGYRTADAAIRRKRALDGRHGRPLIKRLEIRTRC